MEKIFYRTAIVFAFHFFIFHVDVKSQNSEVDTTVNLDLLVVPSSPALTLLGVNPEGIDRPETPSDFAVSVANASNNFSQFPKNYAMEFLPINLLASKGKLYDNFNNGKNLINNMAQTFTLSLGFAGDDAVDTSVHPFIKTRSGMGFRFSLVRGDIDTAFTEYKNSIEEVRAKLKLLHGSNVQWIDSVREHDPTYVLLAAERQRTLEKFVQMARDSGLSVAEKDEQKEKLNKLLKSVNSTLESRIETVKAEQAGRENAYAKDLKESIEKIKFRRHGCMIDFAGGMVLGFRDDDFQNSIVQQYAFWLNGGYLMPKGFSFLGVARYLTSINSLTDENGNKKNETGFDAGVKTAYDSDDNKFSFSAEGIARVMSDTTVYRYSINASYQVGKSQAITFSVGKNFSGKEQFGGNLIAVLNYVIAFGSTRTMVPGEK